MRVFIGVLTLYNWGIVAVLLAFQFLIARFYEKKSGQRSLFPLFSLPALLFVAGALWTTVKGGDLAGEAIGDGLFFIGGAILVALSTFLFRLMMGGKR
ncbi:MAG: hypothetical protein ACOYZ7_07575 [Chloroflexota bacterium]